MSFVVIPAHSDGSSIPHSSRQAEAKRFKMADRTGCHLTIGGLLSDQNAWSLGQVLCAERPYNLEGPLSEKAIYQSILKGRSSWDFEEVDEGRMSSDLQVCLQNLCISYTWTWNWGDDFAPGILLFDARTRKQARFFESEGEICLKACELSDQNRIVEAQSWQEFRQHLRVVTYSSQHELVALLSDQPHLGAYADLIEQISRISLPQ